MKLSQMFQVSSLVATVVTSSLAISSMSVLANPSNNTIDKLDLNQFQQKKNYRIAQIPDYASFPIPRIIESKSLTTTTNSGGSFSVFHREDNTYCGEIFGMTVAIQHVNGNWHNLEATNRYDNRFWWNDTTVNGLIGASTFYNRPVKIVLFVSRPYYGC